MNKTKFGLNATHLRILGLTLMLLDHLWATVVPGNNWMTYVGRMAFPIFAFQTAQGYIHTRDFYNSYSTFDFYFAAIFQGFKFRFIRKIAMYRTIVINNLICFSFYIPESVHSYTAVKIQGYFS